jgi:hypothetical protein
LRPTPVLPSCGLTPRRHSFPGGAVDSPRRPLHLFVLFTALLAVGCSSPATKVLTSANAWAWANARYEERCVLVPGAGCEGTHAALAGWRTRLDEAEQALERGGSLPLQLKELAGAEKRAVASLPKEK